MTGNLFADCFLTNGIKATSEWRTSVAAAQFETFRDGVRQRYDASPPVPCPGHPSDQPKR